MESYTQFPQKVNVWTGIVGLLFIDGTLNSINYVHLQQNYIIPSLTALYGVNPNIPVDLIWFRSRMSASTLFPKSMRFRTWGVKLILRLQLRCSGRWRNRNGWNRHCYQSRIKDGKGTFVLWFQINWGLMGCEKDILETCVEREYFCANVNVVRSW